MPLRTERHQFNLGGWPGGLNRDYSELLLAPEETPDALNVLVDRRGDIRVRPGFSRADTGLTDSIIYAVRYLEQSGNDYTVVYEEDGSPYHASGTSLTFSLQSFDKGAHSNKRSWPFHAAQLDGYLFVFTRRSTGVTRFDGTGPTWTNITNDTLDGTGTAASPQAPQAACATTHKNRIFVGSTEESTGNYNSRIRWSDLPTGEGGNRWEATAFIDVNEHDGSEIVALYPFQGNLLIFKDHSFHVLTGADPSAFALYEVDHRIGTASPYSVAGDENLVFWFDRDQGVFMFDGAEVRRIDDKIHDYLLDNSPRSGGFRAAGWMHEGNYYLSVPWTSGSYNSRTFIYNPHMNAWTEHDWGGYGIVDIEGTWYSHGNNDLTGLYTFADDTETTDAGTAIDWHLETAWWPPASEQGMTKWRLRRADIWVKDDNASMTVDLYVDGVDSNVLSTAITADADRKFLKGYDQLFERMKYRVYGSTS